MRQPSPQQSREPTSLPSPVGGTSGASATYRPDLEGLRGFAITLVVVYHVWFGGVSGGVDVFLALSGYFFVASLLKLRALGAVADFDIGPECTAQWASLKYARVAAASVAAGVSDTGATD